MKNKLFKNVIALSLLANCIFINNAYSSDTEISLDIQSLILLKTISYSHSIQGNKVNIGVVFDPANNSSVSSKDKIIELLLKSKQSIKGKDINILPLSLSSLNSDKSADIFYFTKDINNDNAFKAAKNNKVLTWSSVSTYVRAGDASITVINKNNRPKLLINMKSLKMEGQDLSSQLLKLSEIID